MAAALTRSRKPRATARKRKPSSQCSKRFPCAVRVGDSWLDATVKTYAKYGKPEFVITELPQNAEIVPVTRAFAKKGAARKRKSRAAELKRARNVAEKAMTPAEKRALRRALASVKGSRRRGRPSNTDGMGRLGDEQR